MPVTRITAPQPTTVPGAPSHSPPDTVYAPGGGLATKLGWLSIGLGMAELLAPEVMARLTGVNNRKLLFAYGLRELVCGIGILNSNRPAAWMWARVAGDALDIGTLLTAAAKNEQARGRALGATAAVGGVTALDMMAAGTLTAAAALEG